MGVVRPCTIPRVYEHDKMNTACNEGIARKRGNHVPAQKNIGRGGGLTQLLT